MIYKSNEIIYYRSIRPPVEEEIAFGLDRDQVKDGLSKVSTQDP